MIDPRVFEDPEEPGSLWYPALLAAIALLAWGGIWFLVGWQLAQ